MDVEEILKSGREAKEVIKDLKMKSVVVPSWGSLEKEYDIRKHPVVTDKSYKDIVTSKGTEKVTRITLGWQKLAVKRITELMFAIPVQRIYNATDELQQKAAKIMESIFEKNRINSLNIERGKELFAACEAVTLWYTQEQLTIYAGEESKLKLRCKNYSPKTNSNLYPLFDEYDDLIALSIEYKRKEGDKDVTYFDTYTADAHIRWRTQNGTIEEEVREPINLGKISGVYINREEPVWENQSNNVYEAEWTLSRNGNYIRKNARPTWVVFSDEDIENGEEVKNDNQGRNYLQYGREDKAQYVTWQQALDSIKFHKDELKREFFTQLQLPDMSLENMKTTPMSGEARKMMFIDSQLKVTDESGIWLEFFDREINVVKAHMKIMFPSLTKAIDSLSVKVKITPFQIHDEKERIDNLSNATGRKPIMSQKTAISRLGYADDVDAEFEAIVNEVKFDMFEEPTV